LRLGRIKALEKVNNQRLIERTIERLSPPAQTILVITSQEQFNIISTSLLNVQVVVDLYSGKGALGGIYTGLACADTFYSLAVGCDMPFLNRSLLSYIVEQVANYDVVVPRLDGLLEPLHAVYSKNCLGPIKTMMHEDQLEISHLFNLVKTRYVSEDELAKFDPQHLSFFNINTVADLREARRLIGIEQHCSEK
jgi:molybdopterin-guanine dinucleotide biosynthesis protein A